MVGLVLYKLGVDIELDVDTLGEKNVVACVCFNGAGLGIKEEESDCFSSALGENDSLSDNIKLPPLMTSFLPILR